MKLFVRLLLVLILSVPALSFAAPYLGDFAEDETVHFIWASNDAAGGSVTRATDGTVSVYKDNGTTQSTQGVTDTEDFDSTTGIHVCTIDLSSDAFYAVGANYTVVVTGAVIDSQTVNAPIAHFSIQNRTWNQYIWSYDSPDYTAGDIMRLISSFLAGQTEITENDTEDWDITYRDPYDNKDAIIQQNVGSKGDRKEDSTLNIDDLGS